MKYWAWVKQRGEGCDHTIACGETVWEIETDSWEAAMKEVRLLAAGNPNWEEEEDWEHGGHWLDGDRTRGLIGRITLVEITQEEELPVKQWYREVTAKCREAEQRKREQIERACYEQLKQKYEGRTE